MSPYEDLSNAFGLAWQERTLAAYHIFCKGPRAAWIGVQHAARKILLLSSHPLTESFNGVGIMHNSSSTGRTIECCRFLELLGMLKH